MARRVFLDVRHEGYHERIVLEDADPSGALFYTEARGVDAMRETCWLPLDTLAAEDKGGSGGASGEMAYALCLALHEAERMVETQSGAVAALQGEVATLRAQAKKALRDIVLARDRYMTTRGCRASGTASQAVADACEAEVALLGALAALDLPAAAEPMDAHRAARDALAQRMRAEGILTGTGETLGLEDLRSLEASYRRGSEYMPRAAADDAVAAYAMRVLEILHHREDAAGSIGGPPSRVDYAQSDLREAAQQIKIATCAAVGHVSSGGGACDLCGAPLTPHSRIYVRNEH